jgi:hypothetical protein
MRTSWYSSSVTLFACMATTTFAQLAQQNRTLEINGRTGEVIVVVITGRTYVDLDSLVRIANGSLIYQGNRIVLTLPEPNGGPTTSHSAATEESDGSAFSREFMKAGIEEISLLREWASPLANAIQNGYPVTDSWIADYRGKASSGLHLASAAVSTTADQQGYALLAKEFEMVSEWSTNLVEARRSMNAAKYSTSPDALRADPVSQKIIACGHFLASMLASGSFQDDGSCS